MKREVELPHDVIATIQDESGGDDVGVTIKGPDGEGYYACMSRGHAAVLGRTLVDVAVRGRGGYSLRHTEAIAASDGSGGTLGYAEPTKYSHNFIAALDGQGGFPTIFCTKCGMVAPGPGLPTVAHKEHRDVVEQGCPFPAVWSAEPKEPKGGPKLVCTADNPMPAEAAFADWMHPDLGVVDPNYSGERWCRHCKRFMGFECEESSAEPKEGPEQVRTADSPTPDEEAPPKRVCTADDPMPPGARRAEWEHPAALTENSGGERWCHHCCHFVP